MKKIDLKKKFSNLWVKVKKLAKKLLDNLLKLLKSIWDKFMSLPQKVRLIIYVWLVVIISLLAFIGISNSTKKFYSKYELYEKNVSAGALRYVEANNLYTTKENKLRIELATLKEENYVGASDIDDNSCEGISVVYYEDDKEEFAIDTYLNCDKYTSKYYWDYK